MNDSVLDRIVQVLDEAAAHDPNLTTPPMALLWPDGDRQWETLISHLRDRIRIVTYGEFDPIRKQGPSYWLRCVAASTVELEGAPRGKLVVYLPGVSREALRTIETVASEIAPLSAVQHRCQWISHPNGKDWTVKSLLSNRGRGLGLSIASDTETASALVDSLPELSRQQWNRLENKHIDADFLHSLLNPDPIRSLLDWLDDPIEMRESISEEGWRSFVHQCRLDFSFNPETDGEIEGARRLGYAEGQWKQVWSRFRESPTEFPGIPDRLRQAQPVELLPQSPGAWPGFAEDGEDKLRVALEHLPYETPQQARTLLLELEESHKVRRGHVWADLGLTPLVLALEHLAELARVTSVVPTGQSVEAITDWYATTGWRADWAVLGALVEIDRLVGFAAVEAAIAAVYKPWAETCARLLQSAIAQVTNAETYAASPAPTPQSGDVILFVDGLRLDLANQLTSRLAGSGFETELSTALAALPTVTQTSKPVLVPIDQNLLGPGAALDARRTPEGPTADVRVLRSLMADTGLQVLDATDVGVADGVAWTETGALDSRGHSLGLQLAHEVEGEVQRIAMRIKDLLGAGWNRVHVVTDHGWLLVPGGLPKNEDLPVAVTEVKKGRCARVKVGADLRVPTVPWHWDTDVQIAIAPGISCFEANQTYEHGGVSPQECVVPRLIVSRGDRDASGAAIASMKWRGLTLVVEFSNLPDRATIDLRTSPGDDKSSIADTARTTGGQGREIIFVEDEDFEGEDAYLVVIGSDGRLLVQHGTTVGQNR